MNKINLNVGKIPTKDYRFYKEAISKVLEDAGFKIQDIGAFHNGMDRIGKDDLNKFIYMAGALAKLDISDELMEEMREKFSKDDD